MRGNCASPLGAGASTVVTIGSDVATLTSRGVAVVSWGGGHSQNQAPELQTHQSRLRPLPFAPLLAQPSPERIPGSQRWLLRVQRWRVDAAPPPAPRPLMKTLVLC